MKIDTGLTPDQIDALPAGSDTDILVGKHLFGLASYYPTNSTSPSVPGYQRKGRPGGWAYLPRYTVDATAMLDVLQLLLDKGVHVDIDSGGQLVSLRFYDRGKGGVDGVAAEWSGKLHSLPLALSKAALKLPYL